MFEPPVLSQLMGAGVLVIGFLGVGILAHQREQQELEERRLQEKQDTQTSRILIKSLKWGVILKGNKSVRISAESFRASRLTMSDLKVCDLSH